MLQGITNIVASVQAGRHDVKLDGELGSFRAALTAREVEAGVHMVTVVLTADAPTPPPAVRLIWMHPSVDIQGTWHPGIERGRGLNVNWGCGFVSRATSQAPVLTLFNLAGRNRLTFAASDAMNPLETMAGVVEESGEFVCFVRPFAEPCGLMARYELSVRIDTRDVRYERALGDVATWWAGLPGYAPARVPDMARLPMYSTWYSFHQVLDVPRVLEQCRLAKTMGCEAVIVDDGWQTLDARRYYAFTGDWEPERIPAMRDFVDGVHKLGMKFLLWYGVPQIGKDSKAFPRFADKFLYYHDRHQCGYVDPRFPEVREYLISLYERHMREWGLDGFKLDFVDALHANEQAARTTGGGRDMDSVAEASDRLLSDVMTRLRAINPDVMIEFRQSYVGPLMRKYGNMFRAGDCPNDAVSNRLRTLDIRLLCGQTAAHADMLMWHPDDPVESAALQLLNVLFAVPQISVMIDRVPETHQRMLTHYLRFWRANRDVLLDGTLEADGPEALYQVVRASTLRKRVVAVYGEARVRVGANLPDEWYVINATRGDDVVVELDEAFKARKVEVWDCRGQKVRETSGTLEAGVHVVAVPAGGMARWER